MYRTISMFTFVSLIVLCGIVVCFPLIIPWLDVRDVSVIPLQDLDLMIAVCVTAAMGVLGTVIWIAQFPDSDFQARVLWTLLVLCAVCGALVAVMRVYIQGVQACHAAGVHALPAFVLRLDGGFVRCAEPVEYSE